MSGRLEEAVAELVAAIRAEVAPAAAEPDRLLSIDETARQLGIGRSALYSGPIARGDLRTVLVGRRRLVSSGAIARYINEKAGPDRDSGPTLEVRRDRGERPTGG